MKPVWVFASVAIIIGFMVQSYCHQRLSGLTGVRSAVDLYQVLGNGPQVVGRAEDLARPDMALRLLIPLRFPENKARGMKQFIELDHTRIAYEEIMPEAAGTAFPLVFLHDSLGAISVWKDFPAALAERVKRKAIVYDRQGYGSSGPFSDAPRDNSYLEKQADFLVVFLDALKIDSCVLFGHSDGGSISLLAAAKYPERIKAVVTEGAHVFVEDITLAGIRSAQDAYATTDLKARLARHHGDKVEALFTAWTGTWLRPEFKSWNIEAFLERIACPALTIYGEKDEYGSLRQAEAIASKISAYSEKLVIPGTGHTPHKEAREATLSAAAAFIDRAT